MGPIALPADCCRPSCDEVQTIQVPGPAGAPGAAGSNGAQGASAFTTLSAQFLMPAEGATVNAAVANTSWMVVGQTLFVQTAGYMTVSSITNLNTVVLLNPENTAGGLYASNAAPTTAIPAASKISPGGIQGPVGVLAGAAGGSLEGAFPNPTMAITMAKGDLIVNNNAAVAPRNTRLGVGTNGNNLEADSTAATGLKWAPKNLAGGVNHVTGVLPIANGGTSGATAQAALNALAALITRGDLLVRNSAGNVVPLPLGTLGQVLQSDSSDAVYAKLTPANFGTALGILPLDYIRLDDAAGGGVNGGTFTSGSWQTRAITQEHADTGSHCTLAANQFTLAAGTYRIKARAVGYKCDNHQVRLMNITEATVYGYGTNARSAAASDVATESCLEMRFTIGGARVFELQHQCSATRATDGLGVGNAFGGIMRYLSVELWREVA